MKKFYEKNELWFALSFIIAYCVLNSAANSLNEAIGIAGAVNAAVNLILIAVIFRFIRKNDLLREYGFCRPAAPAGRFLWYIPLAVLASFNLWLGISVSSYANVPSILCSAFNMLLVGIAEELLFRGLLFNAIAKSDNIKQAIIISSVTFGLGHIINLLNGNSEGLWQTVSQIVYAVAFGFLFVMLYYRGGSIIPGIILHSLVDVTSVFSNWESFLYNDGVLNNARYIPHIAVLTVFISIYAFVLTKTLPDNGINIKAKGDAA